MDSRDQAHVFSLSIKCFSQLTYPLEYFHVLRQYFQLIMHLPGHNHMCVCVCPPSLPPSPSLSLSKQLGGEERDYKGSSFMRTEAEKPQDSLPRSWKVWGCRYNSCLLAGKSITSAGSPYATPSVLAGPASTGQAYSTPSTSVHMVSCHPETPPRTSLSLAPLGTNTTWPCLSLGTSWKMLFPNMVTF